MSNIIKSELHSQFQRFLNLILCVFCVSDEIFVRPSWSCPGVGLGRTMGVGGSKKFFQKFNQLLP